VTVNDPAPTKPPSRFLLLDGVAVELSTSKAQVYAMVRSGELPAIKVGGRGQWRVERTKLEGYIAKAYTDTATWVQDNPFGNADVDPDDVDRDEGAEEPRALTEP
jgi:excisionase family DNA binding protein